MQAGATGQIPGKAPGNLPSMSIAQSACPISNDPVIGAPIEDSTDLLFGHMAFGNRDYGMGRNRGFLGFESGLGPW